MAVPAVNGTDYLSWIVARLSMSAPLITTPHPLLPLSFGAAIPESFHRLPCFSIVASVNNNFPLSFSPPSWPSALLPDCVPENMFDTVVNLRDRVGYLPFPTMGTCFFFFGMWPKFSSVLPSWSMCERVVIGQRARLLSWRSAKWDIAPMTFAWRKRFSTRFR